MLHPSQKSISSNFSVNSPMSNNSPNNVPGSSKSNGPIFLFSSPSCTLDNINKGALLVNALNIIYHIRFLEMEKEKREKAKGKGYGVKKEFKNDQMTKSFEFTEDMFHSINTEAFIHVTHLLFDVYDSKETEQRFRNAWPIYDKKIEGLYRRVVLEWMKEIVENLDLTVTTNWKLWAKPLHGPLSNRGSERNPLGMKLEVIGGLIVNPGGERFMKFINSFATFVLYQVTLKKQTQGFIKGRLQHNCFENSSSIPSSIRNKYRYLLQRSSNQLQKDALEMEKKFIKNTIQHRKLMEELKSRKVSHGLQCSDSKKELIRTIMESPQLFPDNVSNLIKNRKEYIKKIPSFERFIAEEIPPDPLCKVTIEAIQKESVKAICKLNQVKQFFEGHTRLWRFLHMDKTNPTVLDGTKLFNPNNQTSGESRSLNSFIAFASTLISEFSKEDTIWKAADRRFLETLASHKQRYVYLNLRAAELRKNDCDLDLYKNNLDFEAKVLSLKLNEIDWRWLSKSENVLTVSNMLSFTPAKVFDINRTTGYTPVLNSFLLHSSKDQGTPSRPHSEVRREQKKTGDSILLRSLKGYRVQSVQPCLDADAVPSTILNESTKSYPSTTAVDSPKSFNSQISSVLNGGNPNYWPSPNFAKPPLDISLKITPCTPKGTIDNDSGGGGDSIFNPPNTVISKQSTPEQSAEARISRLLDSLKESPTANYSCDDSVNSKIEDRSFLDNWEDEKGLMDLSYVSLINDDF